MPANQSVTINSNSTREGRQVGLGVAAVVRDGQAVVIGEMLFSCFPWWEGAETRTAIAAQMARALAHGERNA